MNVENSVDNIMDSELKNIKDNNTSYRKENLSVSIEMD